VAEDKLKPETKKLALILFAVALIPFLPLIIGIWIPDVVVPNINVLSEQTLSSGSVVQLIQCWNKKDFYNTELIQVDPDGEKRYVVLDYDDSKHWSVDLEVSGHVAIVDFRGRTQKEVNLNDLSQVSVYSIEPPPTCALWQ
jgi:hypothetical protein